MHCRCTCADLINAAAISPASSFSDVCTSNWKVILGDHGEGAVYRVVGRQDAQDGLAFRSISIRTLYLRHTVSSLSLNRVRNKAQDVPPDGHDKQVADVRSRVIEREFGHKLFSRPSLFA